MNEAPYSVTVPDHGGHTGASTGGCSCAGRIGLGQERKAVVSAPFTKTSDFTVRIFIGMGPTGVHKLEAVVEQPVVLRRNDDQSFNVMPWSPLVEAALSPL